MDSDARREDIVRRCDEGETFQQAAGRWGITRERARQIYRKAQGHNPLKAIPKSAHRKTGPR